jgi:rhodanese-related sulfurtransferase
VTGTGAPAAEVIALDTPALGDRTYLAHDGTVAAVIDPQRDIDRVLALAGRLGVSITHVFETHLHNDYLTGGLALARLTGAAYNVNGADEVAFDRVPVRDGDVIEVGAIIRVRVIATPGHTFTHLAYAVEAVGPPGPDLTPPRRADAAELRRRIAAGEWVVDLRDRTVFAAGHVAGTLNFAIGDGIATYLGWLIRWQAPLTLLGETAEQVAHAQRELSRVGIGPQAAATGKPEHWVGGEPLRGYPVVRFADLEAVRRHRRVTVLDVRLPLEWQASHVEGAAHIPLHELRARLGELAGDEVWVYCRTGHRASIAASILDAAGYPAVVIDDPFERAAQAGLPLVGQVPQGAAA